MAGGWVTCTQKRFCLPNPVNVHRDTLNQLGFVGRSDLQTKGSPTSRHPGLCFTMHSHAMWLCMKMGYAGYAGYEPVDLGFHWFHWFPMTFSHSQQHQPWVATQCHKPESLEITRWVIKSPGTLVVVNDHPNRSKQPKKRCCTDVAGNLGLVKLPKKMLGKLQGIIPVDGLMTTDQWCRPRRKGPISTTEKCFLEIWLTCGYGSKPGTLVDSRYPKS